MFVCMRLRFVVWFLLLVCLVGAVQGAVVITDAHNITMSASGAETVKMGLRFLVTSPCYLQNITIADGTTATTAYLQHYNRTEIASASISSNTANFANISLLNNTFYYVVVDKGGAEYTKKYLGSATNQYPIVANRVTWINTSYGVDELVGYTASVLSITTIDVNETTSTDVIFTISDQWNSTVINNFTIDITWANSTTETHSTTNGSITLINVSDSSTTLDVLFYGMAGYYNTSLTGQVITVNTSNSIVAEAEAFFRVFSVAYSGYVAYGGVNYTRNLSYVVNLSCPDFSVTNVTLFDSGVFAKAYDVSCNNASQLLGGSYQAGSEGNKNLSFYVYTSVAEPVFVGVQNFTYDLEDPVVSGNFTRIDGFNNHTTNVSLLCVDNVGPLLTYSSVFNGVALYYGNQSNNTVVSNSSVLIDGVNNLTGACSDFFGSVGFTDTELVYAKTLCLIDEKENVLFDVSNVSGARVYYDDNSSFYDFKTLGTNCTNFTGIGTEKLRFQLEYASGDIVTRYVDVTLPQGGIRVCANKEGVTHYEQLIISATQRPVVMKSVFSDCLVAADYTRFAYQDSFLLKAYTISALYYLYTYDGGGQVLLASVDGSVSTYMNLDVLEFAQQSYNLKISGDSVTFEKSGDQEMRIYYTNIAGDIVNASVVISDVASGVVYLSTSELVSPNNFTVYFNWATLNVTNNTLFKVEVTTLDSGGNAGVVKRYFNSLAKSGYIQSGIAFAVAVLLTIFGLTFTATRLTLSWFGIGILLASIALLSFAIAAWYITLMLVIDVIVLVYIVIVMVQQNYPTISG